MWSTPSSSAVCTRHVTRAIFRSSSHHKTLSTPTACCLQPRQPNSELVRSRRNLISSDQFRTLTTTTSRHRTRPSSTNPQTRGSYSIQIRPQHSDGGPPHKEYFQTPGQAPKPDLSPYQRPNLGPYQPSAFPNADPSFSGTARTTLSQQPQSNTHQQIPTPKSSFSNSLVARGIRSTVSIILFSWLGVMAGTALITWEYISPLFEEGSELEAELLEEIRETVDTHPLVDDLRGEGVWIEEDLDPATANVTGGAPGLGATANVGMLINGGGNGKGMNRNMIVQTLKGTRGLVGLKMFHHMWEEFSILVFFTGFGVEGWPDVVHGGIITSMIEEGALRHMEHFYPDQMAEYKGDSKISVNFKSPVKPGEVYAVVIPPAATATLADVRGSNDHGSWANSMTDVFQLMPLFVHLNAAPTITIVRNGVHKDITIKGPDKGPRTNYIHAEATVEIRSIAKPPQTNLLDSIGQANAKFFENVKLTDRKDDGE